MTRIIITTIFSFALAGTAIAAGDAAPKPAPKPVAPTVEQLQKEILEKGGWTNDQKQCGTHGICIIVLGDGGECRCMDRDESGRCILWECGLTGKWGPIQVPAPKKDAPSCG